MAIVEHIAVTAIVMLIASLLLWPQIHYARQTSLYQAALMGLGGYTAAFLVSGEGWQWIWAIMAAAVIGGIGGAMVSAMTHRAREDTFAITTLGVQLVASNLFLLAEPVTGGATGIFFLRSPFASAFEEVVCLAAVTAAALMILWFLPQSRFGRHCRALGDDAVLYEAWGWSGQGLKAILGGMAGVGAAIAGSLLVGHLGVAEPTLFSIAYSITLVTICIFLPGKPLVVLPIASLVFAAAPELLRFVGLDAAGAAYGQQALFYALLVLAAFRERKEARPLPGALTGGAWSQ